MVRLADRFDITVAVEWYVKPQIKQKKLSREQNEWMGLVYAFVVGINSIRFLTT